MARRRQSVRRLLVRTRNRSSHEQPPAKPARLTIDLMVLLPDGTTYLDDAKGTVVDNDAQRVAMKCAAEQYPLWIFQIVKRHTKAQGVAGR